MISLHRFNGVEFYLNADQVKLVESIPDSCITLLNGEKYLVRESIPEIIQKIVDYKYMTTHGFHSVKPILE